jgi:uncharacterized protein
MGVTTGRWLAAGLAAAVVVLGTAGPAVGREGPGAPAPGLREVELSVPTADGLTLPATLRIPEGAPPGPAMVLVHGAGPGPREKYRQEAEAYTRAGVATLTYDKRSAGYSQTERSYSQLADDAVAAADVLRAQPGVDPAGVGLLGLSEGGWVAPLAASRAPDTAFLVVVGGNGVEPLRQQTWAEALKVESAGVRGSLVDAASSGVYRLINSMGMFPEPYYDPAPVLRSLTLPVLGIWGALDRSTPPVESVDAFRAELDRAGNPHYTLRTIAGAEHSLHTTVDGYSEGPDLAPGYPELVGTWAAAAAAGDAPPSSVSGVGDQPRPTAAVPPSAWYESAPAHGVALGLLLAGFAGFGLVAAIRRAVRAVRPGTAREPAPVAARVLAATGITTVLGTLVYLAVLTMIRGGRTIDPGPVLAGRPLPWLALQLLAVTTVVAAAALAAGLVRGRASATSGVGARVPVAVGGPGTVRRPAVRSGGERVRLAMLLVAATVFVPWALYWGLLVP